jgi:hypothetical protein
MSQDHPANPYAAPGREIVTPMPWSQDEGLEYTRAVKFVLDSPNWIVNVLLATACNIVGAIIPILPGLVLIGYQCEMLEALAVRPQQTYPDFKMERIMDYLVRGLWPFVIALIGSIVMIPVLLIIIGIPTLTMGLLASAAGEDGAGVVLAVMVPIIVILTIVTAIACNVVLVPFLLRAALTQDIGASLDLRFAKDFVRKMWKETILAGLFLIVVAIGAQIIGLLLFCIGVLFTVPFVQFAQVHLGLQLYRLYIARGGEKIPLKSTVPAAGV